MATTAGSFSLRPFSGRTARSVRASSPTGVERARDVSAPKIPPLFAAPFPVAPDGSFASGPGSPPTSTSPFGGSSGLTVPTLRRTRYCWPTVQRFVVIQYRSSPAGKFFTNSTKMNGSPSMSSRWLRSAVTDISTLDSSCEPM